MPVSNYFQFYDATNEQRLYEGLVQESIQIYGRNMFYLPKNYGNIDPILLQSDINYFNVAILCEMYVESVEGFTGELDIMSKFGLEIRDRITFSVAKKTFDELVGGDYGILRPNEGDLIYYPDNKKLFEIKWVENKPTFYPFGTLPLFKMSCELIEYSNEVFSTGIPEIDILQTTYTLNILDHALMIESQDAMLLTEDGQALLIEWTPDSSDIENQNNALNISSNNFIDLSNSDPFATLLIKTRG